MGWNSEDERNILACCRACHGAKKSAENLLFGRGLILGFLTELNRIGWPAERAKQMLRDFGCHFVGEPSVSS